jgi:hypothetical protein
MESGALDYLRESFDYFHLEGDEAVDRNHSKD